MAKVKIQGHASGTGVLTVTAPNTSTDRTITLPDESVTLGAAVGGANGVDFNDNVKARFGTGNDFAIWHDGSHTRFQNDTGNLNVRANVFNVTKSDDSENIILAEADGDVKLYRNNVIHLETLATGVRVPVGGVLFGTDTAAANALDDYEEGTWTPAYTFDAGSFSGGYAAQHGYYTKVGRIVTASFYFNTSSVNLSGIDSGTALKIGGLPFASSNDTGMIATTSSFRTQNWNNNAHSPVIGYHNTNTSEIRLARFNGSTGYNTDYKSVSADLRTASDSNQLMGTITYQTA